MSSSKFPNEPASRLVRGTAQTHALSAQEQAVLETIRATPFGTVEVVLHQSRIVQVVKTEKVKLDGGPAER
jgi:hypothetical protein